MDLLCFSLTLFLLCTGAYGTTFTFVNKCEYTVWPGVLPNTGSPTLGTTGFELPKSSSRAFQAPTGWSGRFWGRTGCRFDTGAGVCASADCGSGQVECGGAGAAPPATLAEFTLGTGGGQDFYDVSLVDGYNVPMIIEASGGSGMCASTGCVTDLNLQCPAELRVGKGEGCKSACEAFGSEEYCCSGAFNSPDLCKPSVYSQLFKTACPRSYSYAYDDPTSTFTCAGADYTMTFCPSMPSQKSTKDTSTTTTPTDESGSLSGSNSGSGSVYQGATGSGSDSMLADGSYLAALAMGNSTKAYLSCFSLYFSVLLAFVFSFLYF